jgi:hypothetical protein
VNTALPAGRIRHHVEGLEELERKLSQLQAQLAEGDVEVRQGLLKPAHSAIRFERYDPEASSLFEADARLLIANQFANRLGELQSIGFIDEPAHERPSTLRRLA